MKKIILMILLAISTANMFAAESGSDLGQPGKTEERELNWNAIGGLMVIIAPLVFSKCSTWTDNIKRFKEDTKGKHPINKIGYLSLWFQEESEGGVKLTKEQEAKLIDAHKNELDLLKGDRVALKKKMKELAEAKYGARSTFKDVEEDLFSQLAGCDMGGLKFGEDAFAKELNESTNLFKGLFD
ncbi:hypothetical protein JKY79_01105 [Candidatus Babeliales bacterium]|nr:hypothetical protein [Candidatus Babeliales bacterium]